nr:PolC-type DNA polymerase III [Alicyclobacillus ferrooxydans]
MIETVRVHRARRQLAVVLKPCPVHFGLEAPGADFKAQVAQFVGQFRSLQAVCESQFADANYTLLTEERIHPSSVSEDVINVLVDVLLDWYVDDEGITGNMLRHAARVLQVSDGGWQLQFCLGTEAECAKVQKKQALTWIAEQCKRAFGVQLSAICTVDYLAQVRQEALRKELDDAQQREVADMIAREQELAKRAETVEEKRPEGGDRPWRRKKEDDGPIVPLCLGRAIDDQPISIHDIQDEMRRAVVEGRVFRHEVRTLPSGRTLVQFNITDDKDSISAKLFASTDRQLQALADLKDGVTIRIAGNVQFDTYAKELVFMIQDMQPGESAARKDTATDKRVELHMHSTMSTLDGLNEVKDYVKQAAKWGHQAVAITDHGVAQAFPEAYAAGKKNEIKVILGVEAYVVDDGAPIVYRPDDSALDAATFVVFDTETTGLNAREDTLIELSAVKVVNGEIVDTFTTLIDPLRRIPQKVSELTGITDDMVRGQPQLEDALNRFRSFASGAVWVAHNAEFDVGFLGQCARRLSMPDWKEPVIDTLALARALYPGEKNYRLKTLTQKFEVQLVNHHRALADSEATAKVFLKLLEGVKARQIHRVMQLNTLRGGVDVTRVRPFHLTMLAQNTAGLRNVYELISFSHTETFHRVPRLPRSELSKRRQGVLIGSACQQGEVFQSFLRGKSIEEIEEVCRFYDYLEIQPLLHYEPLIREGLIQSLESVKEIHRQIVDIGKRLEIPVVATGDVHYLNPEDAVYRDIFLQSQGTTGPQPPMHFYTTDEMLSAFSYLGEDAMDVVVHNTVHVAELIEEVRPMPNELFTPVIPGAEEEIERMSYEKARRLYGDPLPEIVEARLKKELNSIITHGFAVIYLIAHKLVVKSLSDGYLVGSRGSVGSSLVATMTDITEVNPLPPHYRCETCKYNEFIEDGSVGSGFDLPEKDCPNCGTPLVKDGQDIPFETFLGFKGDKVPDIDLNFSGEYQPRAHAYTVELFGEDHVFRAGTISTVAEKTAYGYVRKFADERGMVLRNAEIDRLVQGCTGIKRTTGQHPGGMVVVPSHKSIYEFTPVQYPADDQSAGMRTTHFDYHSGLESCLLKLDILGHDDPTVIRMLQDLTGVDPKTIPLDDSKVIGLFSGTDTLGVASKDIRSNTGTYAIPEFGTKFVRQMLEDTRPTTFSELVRISGLSHGTDVWLNNAQDLIRRGVATLSEVICARDDIMVYLIYKGLDPSRAFKIMEGIRKGKGVTEDDESYMRQFDVPDWYIESGRRIKYMFPKAHAAAYVLMAVRIAWFKIHHPLAFYATYFTVRADDFDVELMARGREAIVARIEEIEAKGNAALPKEKSLLTVLEVALEMVVRGFRFLPVNLYQSHANKFQVIEDQQALLPPFAAIPGVGEAAAASLHRAASEGEFLSIEDLQSRSRVSKTVVEILEGLGCLKGMPETNQLSLFDL